MYSPDFEINCAIKTLRRSLCLRDISSLGLSEHTIITNLMTHFSFSKQTAQQLFYAYTLQYQQEMPLSQKTFIEKVMCFTNRYYHE